MTRITKSAIAAVRFLGICLVATAPANAKLGLNGASLNGESLNGENLNGVALNGESLNGTSFNGVVLNGPAMEGTGSAPVDAVVLPRGETINVR
jgi:uncharacterized protein YjbI with pentapeptide repeats